MNKIFGIGLSKTGTSSLNAALEILGFRARHLPFMAYHYGRLVLEPRQMLEYDAFTDTPVANCFKYLDSKYPDSKFIYTIRDKDSWLRSCEKHWGNAETDLSIVYERFKLFHLRMSVYGGINFDKDRFSRAYDRHDERVRKYFGKSNQLLILNICAGEGWQELCSFLNADIPEQAFPAKNVTALKESLR